MVMSETKEVIEVAQAVRFAKRMENLIDSPMYRISYAEECCISLYRELSRLMSDIDGILAGDE